MSTLLVDNYDSYTYNVFHLLAAVTGEAPIVVRNDVVTWRVLSRWDFDAIVLSPGPGRPERWHDFGVCADILRHSEAPVLGVCLGHQGLGHVLNGTVASAPTVMHGRLSGVRHDGTGLFQGIPQGFSVVRYHSLVVASQLGEQGRVIAWTDEGIVMGIEHQSRPMWGVQFHPESIATEHGHRLFENFYRLAAAHRRSREKATQPGRLRPRLRQKPARQGSSPGRAQLQLRVRSIAGIPYAEGLFERLFGECDRAFWLDSADAPTTLAQRSFLGTTAGPHSASLEYDVDEKRAVIRSATRVEEVRGSIFELLDRELDRQTLQTLPNLPPGLIGGYVGYLGYECKADCGSPNVHRSDMPDAAFMLANRVVCLDHLTGETHLFAVCQEDEVEEAERWLDDALTVALELLTETPESRPNREPAGSAVTFRCGRGREQYLEDIARCQAFLEAGESYEVCLTDQIHTDAAPQPFELYRLLRKRNPAPFAAYLKFGENVILSSSPERFIGIDRDGHVQARPIKGTARRSADPTVDETRRQELLTDEKTFAEHLMIVDLLRNDLGRVCELDSVRVPQFMVVEPYATVHQLISTITGDLDPERTPVECVRACFPGGSMTGAPKLRTMGIIDDIEREARGVYSGGLGYFGLDGSVDLSIVIRTIVMRPGSTTIGAGGAIVMQSEPEDEFDELMLKAQAPMSAIAQAVTGSEAPDAWTIDLGTRSLANTA